MTDEKGFVIKDRRLFSETEQQQSEQPPDQKAGKAEDRPSEPSARKNGAESKAGPKEAQRTADEPRLPAINFATFVLSLNSSALVHLGIIEDPASGKKEKLLPLAKQTIDILGMLEEKTRGNLSNEEENILKHILYDLRISYVKAKG